MIFEKLASILAEHCDIDVFGITMDTTFETLGIDSLDMVEMLMELEEDLGVELELDEKVETVGQMVRFVEKKIGR
jgi:acyl carrier protein